MKIEPRSLPIAEEIIKVTGLQMTYPYDDLVFVEHNPFLLRFNDENPQQIFVHFNQDCLPHDKRKLLSSMEAKAHSIGMVLVENALYTMEQKEGAEEFELKFLN